MWRISNELIACDTEILSISNALLVRETELIVSQTAHTNDLITLQRAVNTKISTNDALNMIKDLRVGSQTFGVSNGNATIRMFVDESSDLTARGLIHSTS